MKSKDSNSKKSVSYQKKDWRGYMRQSFFWYENDKDLKVCFLVMRINLQLPYSFPESHGADEMLIKCLVLHDLVKVRAHCQL